MNKVSKAFFLISLMGLSYFPNIHAVFCTVQKYSMPETDKELWLFGDVHADIDAMEIPTRIQQHTLLEMAKKQNGLVIAENVSVSKYMPYYAAAGINISMLAISLYYKQYFNAVGSVASFPIILYLFNIEKEKATKPTFSLQKYLEELKSRRGPHLAMYGASPMINLVDRCLEQGISAIDSEFRFHYLGMAPGDQSPLAQSFAYYKNYIARKFTGNKVRYPLTLADYCQTNDAVIGEIRAAALAEPALASFYEDCIKHYYESETTKIVRSFAENNPEVALSAVLPELALKTGKASDLFLYMDFAEHNQSLLDGRVLRDIANNRNRNKIFVCTGILHMDNIAQGIQQLGYKKVAGFGDGNLQKLKDLEVMGGQFIAKKNLDYFIIDLETVFSEKMQ